MNTRFLKTISLRAALLLGTFGALTVAANAQSPLAKASVPFEFAASGAMMPAGEYTINAADLSGVLVLRSATGASVALLTTFSSVPSTASTVRLIFERHDGMAYLSSVEWPGQSARVISALKPAGKTAVASAVH